MRSSFAVSLGRAEGSDAVPPSFLTLLVVVSNHYGDEEEMPYLPCDRKLALLDIGHLRKNRGSISLRNPDFPGKVWLEEGLRP